MPDAVAVADRYAHSSILATSNANIPCIGIGSAEALDGVRAIVDKGELMTGLYQQIKGMSYKAACEKIDPELVCTPNDLSQKAGFTVRRGRRIIATGGTGEEAWRKAYDLLVRQVELD